MSTIPNGDGEDRRLPATWEEYQRARRDVWKDGVSWAWEQSPVKSPMAARHEATRRYPITKRVPRVVKVKGFYARVETNLGTYENITGLRFYFDRDCTQRHTPHWHDEESVAAMADLLANPFEEVPE